MNLDPFFYWINERHRIYLNKTAGNPWPWTADPILQQYRFCNVFRELDTVTIWIRENIVEKFPDHDNLPFLLAMARQINWPPTLDTILKYSALPDEWDPEEIRRLMLDRQQMGEKVYTGAYMLSGGGCAGHDKPWYTCNLILDPVYKAIKNPTQDNVPPFLRQFDDPLCTLENSVKWFSQFDGWAGFLSYEVVTDLRHTSYLNGASDIMTWANPGPGANRGLNRLFGRPLEFNTPKKQAIEEMQFLLELCNKVNGPNNFGNPIQDHVPRPMEMRDVEHSLCETDKYMRVKLGEGKPRAKYYPPTKK